MSGLTNLHGGKCRSLSSEEISTTMEWLLSQNGTHPFPGLDLKWAVLQCADTFVWGIRDLKHWRWSSEVETVLRASSRDLLLEARLFGPDAEVLICRQGSGFAGRLLEDEGSLPGTAQELMPLSRRALFLPSTNHEANEDGAGPQRANRSKTVETLDSNFVRRTMPDGRVTVTPHGRAVLLKEYLADSDDTGIVRIAATRFVRVE